MPMKQVRPGSVIVTVIPPGRHAFLPTSPRAGDDDSDDTTMPGGSSWTFREGTGRGRFREAPPSSVLVQ